LTLLSSVVNGNSTDRGWDGFPVQNRCFMSGNAGYPGADGGGLYNQGGSVTVVDTTFAGNTTGGGGNGSAGADARSVDNQPCVHGGAGGTGSHGGEGGAIFNNDGTITLLGSAIYDNITGTGGTAAAGCTPIDQRGIIRPQPVGGRCDIGAYEFKP
jgi:hypothetical protein